MRILYLDGEKALGKRFDRWVARKGLSIEESAPYTQAQNGPAERSGGVIIQKARCMRVHAGLPEELWPEPVQTAAYVTNRTPSRQLNWKTPLEMLQKLIGVSNP